jgi:hypothetical protein
LVWPRGAWGDARRRSAARVAALAAAIVADDSVTPAASTARPVAVTSLFDTSPGSAVSGRPMMNRHRRRARDRAVVIAAMANRNHAQPVAAEADSARSSGFDATARAGSTLTVSGLVRNPRTGAPLTRIAASYSPSIAAAALLADRRRSISRRWNRDESPFVVTVRDVANVGRFRVSFRTETGILRHVDRRAVDLQASAK